ncbi:hypothetical protein ACFWPK_33960 [Nocardia sp. NPDC058519]|uniref:hypothetical protein n=1 Tax=Nocardia sp. NPDC058519 TaxID=3346535 RepID=UPI00365F6B20
MAWDRDDSDDSEGTEQQWYYGQLGFARRAGMTALVDKLVAGGPPPPRSADGPIGWLVWHEHHLPTSEELTQLVDQLLGARLITATQLSTHTLTPHDATSIATLRALIATRTADDHPTG